MLILQSSGSYRPLAEVSPAAGDRAVELIGSRPSTDKHLGADTASHYRPQHASSDAVEARIRERALTLERLHPKITGYHVTVEAQHKQQVHGRLYHIAIHLIPPEGDIIDRSE